MKGENIIKKIYKLLIAFFVLLCITGTTSFAEDTLGDIIADDNAVLSDPDNYNNFGFSYEDMLNNPDYFVKNDSDISIMSTNSIMLNYSKISIAEGENFTLTATTNGTVKNISWSTSDSSVSSVVGGIITGEKAGVATVTATCTFTDDTTAIAVCTVNVYIPNAVYYLQNKNSGLRLEVYNGLILPNTKAIQYSNRSAASVAGLRQMWKVYFLGNGRYSIRPYHKLNIGAQRNGLKRGYRRYYIFRHLGKCSR